MIPLKEALDAIAKLEALGASPAVQAFFTQKLADWMGVDQKVLDAAIAAAKDAPPPREA